MDSLASESTSQNQESERKRIDITGIVQGVGFRPFIYRLAESFQLKGYVCNEMGTVSIEIEGEPSQILKFTQALRSEIKEPAVIHTISEMTLAPIGYNEFSIRDSKTEGSAGFVFPPDLSICRSCLSELKDPQHRLYNYPFISCTDCGPRYSIIRKLPYDRAHTTMHDFLLCPLCESDYQDHAERRFHAQTLACSACGPSVEVSRDESTRIIGDWRMVTEQALLDGEIVAVKGLGGFHLICDAAQPSVIEKLRIRKRRVRKPFALMARDLLMVEKYYYVSPTEKALLEDRRGSIVLLKPRPSFEESFPLENLAKGYSRVGVMLPYTPLHYLLFTESFPFLVATSGNKHGHPIAKTTEQALSELRAVAGLFVHHPREIVTRVEDSVVQVIEGEIQVIRRSRGYVPESITIPIPQGVGKVPAILGVGAEMKNAFCLVQQQQAVFSPHIGDMDQVEQVTSWKEGLQHMTQLLGTPPRIIAYDPHPKYQISKVMRETRPEATFVPVYHHHAHMAACMAEHGLDTPVIGCILDGTGYGRDGTLWGFEIVAGNYVDFHRICSLQPVPLPGGEAAIRLPWIQAVSLYYIWVQDSNLTRTWAETQFPSYKEKVPLVLAQLQGRIPAPWTTSAGRLFDAVSALLGLCQESSYEGEAAILLGEKADGNEPGTKEERYSFVLEKRQFLIRPFVQELISDLDGRVPIVTMARKFHHTVAEMVLEGSKFAREETGCEKVVLSGGVWNNRYLLSYAKRLLVAEGFQVYTPQQVPAGDGGIALGQAVSALWRWHQDVSIGTS
ncbi:carbamoyltransferase HypF [Ammoniphilus sp. YIM 78166]|uniref:carbamoyltransferase HypF n=1 Tax=Ammoniphilus sp. YIM 78166 TaxID=1644106 RepID=UPI001070353E|nr:carbamoyltransferase HypF [Ammoniphilus sp. YIM 78166]